MKHSKQYYYYKYGKGIILTTKLAIVKRLFKSGLVYGVHFKDGQVINKKGIVVSTCVFNHTDLFNQDSKPELDIVK